jgi:hypothetical protein
MNNNKCTACKGIGLIVRTVPSSIYACGFHNEAVTCPECLGSGRNIPTCPDQKLAAAGGDR